MARPRHRHYRVAQKAVEEQVCQHEDEHRRDSLVILMLIIVLITQLLGLAVKIHEMCGCGSDHYSD